jgi:hypothetical protein
MHQVRDKYAATATAKEGALTFVDGEPYYADRGPAGMRTHLYQRPCRYEDTYIAEAPQV